MLHLKYTALKILTNANKFKNKKIKPLQVFQHCIKTYECNKKQSKLDIKTILTFIFFPF